MEKNADSLRLEEIPFLAKKIKSLEIRSDLLEEAVRGLTKDIYEILSELKKMRMKEYDQRVTEEKAEKA